MATLSYKKRAQITARLELQNDTYTERVAFKFEYPQNGQNISTRTVNKI